MLVTSSHSSQDVKPFSVGLADSKNNSGKVIKLMKAAFYAKLHDMHKSEPFSSSVKADDQGEPLPDDWYDLELRTESHGLTILSRLLRETLDSPLTYSRARDIHATGIILLQMLLGLDVTKKFPDPATAMHACK